MSQKEHRKSEHIGVKFSGGGKEYVLGVDNFVFTGETLMLRFLTFDTSFWEDTFKNAIESEILFNFSIDEYNLNLNNYKCVEIDLQENKRIMMFFERD